jgi:hypothetical protein
VEVAVVRTALVGFNVSPPVKASSNTVVWPMESRGVARVERAAKRSMRLMDVVFIEWGEFDWTDWAIMVEDRREHVENISVGLLVNILLR